MESEGHGKRLVSVGTDSEREREKEEVGGLGSLIEEQVGKWWKWEGWGQCKG